MRQYSSAGVGQLQFVHALPCQAGQGTPAELLRALGPLLQLFHLATSAHAACAALLPQIRPLPGRAVGSGPSAATPAAACVAPSSYFRALDAQQEGLPDLAQLAQACGLAGRPVTAEEESVRSSGELADPWQ